MKTVSFETLDTKVGDVLSNIVDNGRHKYEFDVNHTGCRYWVYTVLVDLERADHLGSGSAASALEAITYYWQFSTDKQPNTQYQYSRKGP